MNTKIMCFSDNFSDVKIAFTDYMNQYLSDVQKREGYQYDTSISFAEKENKVNAIIAKEVSKLASIDFSATNAATMASNPTVKWAYFAVVNELIDMIVPNVLDKSIGAYTEQRTGAMGDSFNFTVEPNDLFYVSKVGRDQRTVEFQKQFVGQTTIVPENRAISVSVNFYKVMCGLESIAKFVMKAVLSLEAQITKDAFTAFNTAMADLPTTPTDGNLKVTGFSKPTAMALVNRVTAFNNAPAVFLGTNLAVSNILPDGSAYRYMMDSDFVKMGYVKTAFGTDVMVMPQVADWTTPYKTVLDDKKIYVISPSLQKPVKVCYEGTTITRPVNAEDTADLTQSVTLNKSYGIGICTNAIAGLITLS